MSEDRPDRNSRALSYERRLRVGEVAAQAVGPGVCRISVGPPPLRCRFSEKLPIAGMAAFLSIVLTLLIAAAMNNLLTVEHGLLAFPPLVLVWAWSIVELVMLGRGRTGESYLSVADGQFRFAYPRPWSALETLPALLVVGVRVDRSWKMFRQAALIIELHPRTLIHLFRGYPTASLDKLSELLGPALGMVRVDTPAMTGISCAKAPNGGESNSELDDGASAAS